VNSAQSKQTLYNAVEVCLQQASGDCNRIQHWLRVHLRSGDHAQHVAGGGLRVQRRRQLAIARLELDEQPHILDRSRPRNHRSDKGLAVIAADPLSRL
jgi:hypothetical protein